MSPGLLLAALLAAAPARAQSAAGTAQAGPPAEAGARFFYQGDLEHAAAAWKARRRAKPDPFLDALVADADGALGRRALGRGDRRRAASLFGEAAKLAPKDPQWKRLARLARSVAAPAAADLDDGAELDRLYSRLLLDQAGRSRPAPAAKARKRKAGSADYEEALRRYYAGDYDGAMETLESIVADAPSHRKARHALRLVSDALRRDAADQRYQEGLRAYYAGDSKLASEKLLLAIELDSSHEKAKQTLARIQKNQAP